MLLHAVTPTLLNQVARVDRRAVQTLCAGVYALRRALDRVGPQLLEFAGEVARLHQREGVSEEALNEFGRGVNAGRYLPGLRAAYRGVSAHQVLEVAVVKTLKGRTFDARVTGGELRILHLNGLAHLLRGVGVLFLK